MSISSKKLYCRVYSLESGYLCDSCEKPFGTGYASKKPLSARSFGANRINTVKMKQMKTTDRIPDKVSIRRLPTLKRAENGKRKMKTTDRIPDETCVRRMPTLKCVENGKRKQMKTTDRKSDDSVRRMPTLKPAENVGRKAGIADKLKEKFAKKLPNSKHVKSFKKESGGQKILTKNESVGDVRKSNMDCYNIQNLDKMSKCVVRIRIDPLLVQKIMEYENRLKVQTRSRNK
ncbi:hypothetical protein JTE90_002452 [Oedothorax gibbosus]|uniref:Uncharacterized protein n=1 Tax=Oedothorax gibbosus TaxID=931172 RepID=A0AAV6UWC9_9ARAC|nr:hypothetical protein JTE90_002452 [Oedothorax gibbosus]